MANSHKRNQATTTRRDIEFDDYDDAEPDPEPSDFGQLEDAVPAAYSRLEQGMIWLGADGTYSDR